MNKFESGTLPYSSSERIAMGRALRDEVPRQAHADWQPRPDRRDVIDILGESNLGRVPDLIPIRYGRMLANPFAFLRGSAALMAYDLANTPSSGIRVQACGDCHLANFGLFATPERNLVFDLNDFDETLPAPWEWDIKRLAASFVVAERANRLADKSNEAAVRVLAGSYRTHLRDYAKMRVLDVWYSRLDDKTLIDSAPNVEAREYRKRVAAKARASIAEYLFPKITDGSVHSWLATSATVPQRSPGSEARKKRNESSTGRLLTPPASFCMTISALSAGALSSTGRTVCSRWRFLEARASSSPCSET